MYVYYFNVFDDFVTLTNLFLPPLVMPIISSGGYPPITYQCLLSKLSSTNFSRC